jgi:hypothetical protein
MAAGMHTRDVAGPVLLERERELSELALPVRDPAGRRRPGEDLGVLEPKVR